VNVLFLHAHFPGHYGHLAPALAADPGNRVVFGTAAAGAAMARVDVRILDPRRAIPAAHPYLRPLEDAVRLGQAAWRLCRDLRGEGFVPDVVCAHAGFGPGLYVKEAFPDTPLVTYFEWFYRSCGADADFLDGPVHPDDACRIHTANAALLLELAACDAALCPTAFQRAQFPAAFRDRLTVLHDGIDTDRIRPAPGTPMVLPGLDPTGAEAIVTYATRGMEAYRGFPQFMRAAADLVERRPGLHVVVGGTDATFYGPRRADGRPWGEAMRAELAGRDLSRIHFVGPLAPGPWLRLLQATTVHVYLTVPFVLSWSLIEAMAAGCCIVGSDTAPVREAIDDGVHGLLADMRAPASVADRIATALDDAGLRSRLGRAARDRAVARYALSDRLADHLAVVRRAAGRHDSETNRISMQSVFMI
jgi:glycosyltransferase involved in cell wall biosynthesis